MTMLDQSGPFANPTPKPLAEVARDHSTSRLLSQRTRDYFRLLAAGNTPAEAKIALQIDNFDVWEMLYTVAASIATRIAGSPMRRFYLSDLDRLRLHLFTEPDKALPTGDEFWQVTLTVKGKGGEIAQTVEILSSEAARLFEDEDIAVTRVDALRVER